MGGRGKPSKTPNAKQLTFNDVENRQKIQDIITKSTQIRDELLSSGSNLGTPPSSTTLKKCACCGEYTLPVNIEYAVCSICGWIDDKYQNTHPDSLNGKNSLTLNQAKDIYKTKNSLKY